MGRFEVRVCGARNIGDVQKVSLPDPYVKVKLGDDKKSQIKFKTRVIDNNLNPVWDELFKFQVADYDGQQVVFEVWNDNVLKDDVLGRYRLALNGLTRGVMQDVWVILSETTLTSAELHIRVLAIDFGLEPAPGQPVYASIEAAEAANQSVVSDVHKKGKTGGPNTLTNVGGFAGQQQMQQNQQNYQSAQMQYQQQQPQTVYVQQQPAPQAPPPPQPQVVYVQSPPPSPQPNVVYMQSPPQQPTYAQQPLPPQQQPHYYQQVPPQPNAYYPQQQPQFQPAYYKAPPMAQYYQPPPR